MDWLPSLRDLPLERLGRLRMDHVVNDDAGALAGQFENDRLADPAVAAGDDGNLVLQRHAGVLDNEFDRFAASQHEPARPAPSCASHERRVVLSAKLANEIRDQSGPAGLVRGAAAAAIVAVEVFVEQDVVLEMGIGLKFFVVAENRAPAVGTAQEELDHAAAQFVRDLVEREHDAGAGRALDLEPVAVDTEWKRRRFSISR